VRSSDLLPTSCDDYHEVWEPQPPVEPSGPIQASTEVGVPSPYFYIAILPEI
jgi:hypothetical protein